VLYAPTWEGWTNDPAHTSVIRAGAKLVERLTARPDVRVVYKPHPLTGSVSKAAMQADLAIRAAITRAGGRHKVAAGPGQPTLYEFFNECDILVADISSVLTDFVESQKPYVVVNLTGRPDEQFRADFPSASAAYLLHGTVDEIDTVIDSMRSQDPMAAARRELKRYLLGPDEPDATTRFTGAVDAAYERAVKLCPVRPALDVSAV
jgi:CDP-glycerol glycerophosphotransferase (TagB/SpsB family)